MDKNQRFRIRDSDRSGFRYLYRELVKDKGGFLVGPDEFDDPPPSTKSLGGEGDIATGAYFRDSTATTIDDSYLNPTFYITAAGGITPTFDHPYVRVTGSNSAVTITADPAISSGQEGKVLTLFCTDSGITINNGNGVSLMGSMPIVMTSGSVITFFYSTANNAWNETSRVQPEQGIGG